MKIVILGPAWPFRGGIAQFSGVLSKALMTAGHDVALVNFRKQFPKILFPGKTQFDDSPDALKVESERVFTAWNPLAWLRTARTIKRHKPDLILVMWWMPFFAAGYWAVAKLLGPAYRGRIGYLLHNVVPHEKRPGDMFLSRLALGTAHYYLLLSRTEEGEMRRIFPDVSDDRIAYSPHPVYDCYLPFDGPPQDARRETDLPADGKLLLFFGFVRRYKGLDLLLRALPHIRRSHPDVKLVVVGEFYEKREEYDKLLVELDIADAVIVRDGYCPSDMVGKYFAAADAVVLPYRSATQSGIIQVAYALGTPVITTNVGGLGEVVTDGMTGLIVPPEDVTALSAAVERYYAMGGRDVFSGAVRREAKRFSWEALAKTIEERMKAEG
ncbi:MAG TPA: glycosyltransferase [bacterium]|jgi:glycosyltransferase involved in cell wall biosynthesis